MNAHLHKVIRAALLGAVVMGVPLAAFAQTNLSGYASQAMDQPFSPTRDAAAVPFDGPRPSSLRHWRDMTSQTVPTAAPAGPTTDAPRPSSLANWPGMTGNSKGAYDSSADPSFAGVRPGPAH
jgi:hypothetical protein